MAIVQISRITQRKGLQENLPQLAGAEFGWSVDTRRLFIGNGTLEEGAPVIGNTEILTEFSDIFAFQTNYTYKGLAAGYEVQTGPTSNNPVSQSLQSWLDQFATVKDFGAVGDGITDDTAAINRALFQLFCREVNPQIRRSLFFPAGVYKVSETIIIPPYATLYGEGLDNSIIQMDVGDDSTLRAYVARTGDSLQQTGVNIGNNGATVPQNVTISNMGFKTLDNGVDVFLVEDATNCSFTNVSFLGPLTTSNLNTDADDLAGIRIESTASLVSAQNRFDGCVFSGMTYGVVINQETQATTFNNCEFNILYRGVVLGETPVNGGPQGTRIVYSAFDNIYEEGVYIGAVTLNATAHNLFLDVGNHFLGTGNPASPVIFVNDANNICVGDMFQRTDLDALTDLRIEINDTASIAFTNGQQLAMGTQVKETGQKFTLVNNESVAETIFTTTLKQLTIEYKIIRDTTVRSGTLNITNFDGTGSLTYTDDFVENAPTGITLLVTQSAGTISLQYTSTNTGINGTFSYSITHFNP